MNRLALDVETDQRLGSAAFAINDARTLLAGQHPGLAREQLVTAAKMVCRVLGFRAREIRLLEAMALVAATDGHTEYELESADDEAFFNHERDLRLCGGCHEAPEACLCPRAVS